MNKLKKYLMAACLSCNAAIADVIELSCTEVSNGMSSYVVIDTQKETVNEGVISASNVKIDRNTIVYLMRLDESSEFLVNINRTTGVKITINTATRKIDSESNCEPINPKF